MSPTSRRAVYQIGIRLVLRQVLTLDEHPLPADDGLTRTLSHRLYLKSYAMTVLYIWSDLGVVSLYQCDHGVSARGIRVAGVDVDVGALLQRTYCGDMIC